VLRWYLVHTKPSAETVAQANLERQGYESYLPRLVRSVLRGQQRRERSVPLFPRYLFLRLREGSQPLGPVRSSVGVSGVVRFGPDYAIVPDEAICQLQARADPLTGLHRLTPAKPLVSGAAVRIASGPFDGLEGIFQREDGAERVIVLLRLLGHDTPVRVPAGWIVPHCDSRDAARPRPSMW
jgi:transcriptional antiterminator RfaH